MHVNISKRLLFHYSYSDEETELLSGLEIITQCLFRLKKIRDWKFMSMRTTDLLKNELQMKDKMKQDAAREAWKMNLELAERKKEALKQNWNKPKYTIFGKQTMKQNLMKEIKKKTQDGKEIGRAHV